MKFLFYLRLNLSAAARVARTRSLVLKPSTPSDLHEGTATKSTSELAVQALSAGADY
jgi:hypothetical protein